MVGDSCSSALSVLREDTTVQAMGMNMDRVTVTDTEWPKIQIPSDYARYPDSSGFLDFGAERSSLEIGLPSRPDRGIP
jgi:hypothetical protein